VTSVRVPALPQWSEQVTPLSLLRWAGRELWTYWNSSQQRGAGFVTFALLVAAWYALPYVALPVVVLVAVAGGWRTW